MDTATSSELRRGSNGTKWSNEQLLFHMLFGDAGMERTFDRIVNGLAAALLHASDAELARGMYFPTGWDPYFRDYMTLADVYHYATQHYQHHRRQLTLARVTQAEGS